MADTQQPPPLTRAASNKVLTPAARARRQRAHAKYKQRKKLRRMQSEGSLGGMTIAARPGSTSSQSNHGHGGGGGGNDDDDGDDGAGTIQRHCSNHSADSTSSDGDGGGNDSVAHSADALMRSRSLPTWIQHQQQQQQQQHEAHRVVVISDQQHGETVAATSDDATDAAHASEAAPPTAPSTDEDAAAPASAAAAPATTDAVDTAPSSQAPATPSTTLDAVVDSSASRTPSDDNATREPQPEPVDSTPPAHEPADSTPPAHEPADSTPPAHEPADSTPPAHEPADSTPPAHEPADSTPPAHEPADSTPPSVVPTLPLDAAAAAAASLCSTPRSPPPPLTPLPPLRDAPIETSAPSDGDQPAAASVSTDACVVIDDADTQPATTDEQPQPPALAQTAAEAPARDSAPTQQAPLRATPSDLSSDETATPPSPSVLSPMLHATDSPSRSSEALESNTATEETDDISIDEGVDAPGAASAADNEHEHEHEAEPDGEADGEHDLESSQSRVGSGGKAGKDDKRRKKERKELERKEKERKEKERLEKERKEQEKRDKKEKEKREREARKEKERLEKERKELEKLERKKGKRDKRAGTIRGSNSLMALAAELDDEAAQQQQQQPPPPPPPPLPGTASVSAASLASSGSESEASLPDSQSTPVLSPRFDLPPESETDKSPLKMREGVDAVGRVKQRSRTGSRKSGSMLDFLAIKAFGGSNEEPLRSPSSRNRSASEAFEALFSPRQDGVPSPLATSTTSSSASGSSPMLSPRNDASEALSPRSPLTSSADLAGSRSRALSSDESPGAIATTNGAATAATTTPEKSAVPALPPFSNTERFVATMEDEEGVELERDHCGIITVRGAALDKLLHLACHPSGPDYLFEQSFLLAFPSLMSCKEVLQQILNRVLQHRQQQEHQQADRALSLLHKWMLLLPADFREPEMRQGVVDLLEELDASHALRDSLQQALDKSVPQPEQRIDLSTAPMPHLPPNNDKLELSHLKPLEVARQLCRINHRLFQRIDPREFLGQAWMASNKQERAPNLVAFIERFNLESRWASHLVLMPTSADKRAAALRRLLKVAQACIDLHNYSSAMAIFSGLSAASVQRLKDSWEALSVKNWRSFSKIEALLAMDNNYRQLREEIKQASLPIIPFVAVLLHDLTFIEDGNPSRLESGLINFVKHAMVADVVGSIVRYQSLGYHLAPVSSIAAFVSAEQPSDDELYSLSLVREPRKVKKPATDTKKQATIKEQKDEQPATVVVNPLFAKRSNSVTRARRATVVGARPEIPEPQSPAAAAVAPPSPRMVSFGAVSKVSIATAAPAVTREPLAAVTGTAAESQPAAGPTVAQVAIDSEAPAEAAAAATASTITEEPSQSPPESTAPPPPATVPEEPPTCADTQPAVESTPPASSELQVATDSEAPAEAAAAAASTITEEPSPSPPESTPPTAVPEEPTDAELTHTPTPPASSQPQVATDSESAAAAVVTITEEPSPSPPESAPPPATVPEEPAICADTQPAVESTPPASSELQVATDSEAPAE